MSNYPIPETAMAEASGVSQYDLKKQREELLNQGEDFDLVKNAICLTEDAALLVFTSLDASSPALLLERILEALRASEKKRAVSVGGDERTVAAVTGKPINTRILFAELEGSGESIRVKVRDSALFVARRPGVEGQRIPVIQTKTVMWKLDGKAPRRKGRMPGFDGKKRV